jgi:hypothetical protein
MVRLPALFFSSGGAYAALFISRSSVDFQFAHLDRTQIFGTLDLSCFHQLNFLKAFSTFHCLCMRGEIKSEVI